MPKYRDNLENRKSDTHYRDAMIKLMTIFLSKILMSKDMEWHIESADNKSQAIVLYLENHSLN